MERASRRDSAQKIGFRAFSTGRDPLPTGREGRPTGRERRLTGRKRGLTGRPVPPNGRKAGSTRRPPRTTQARRVRRPRLGRGAGCHGLRYASTRAGRRPEPSRHGLACTSTWRVRQPAAPKAGQPAELGMSPFPPLIQSSTIFHSLDLPSVCIQSDFRIKISTDGVGRKHERESDDVISVLQLHFRRQDVLRIILAFQSFSRDEDCLLLRNHNHRLRHRKRSRNFSSSGGTAEFIIPHLLGGRNAMRIESF